MINAVDSLASSYHWSKQDILENVYPDELYLYVQEIEKRKIVDLKMQLAIVQNPHAKDPKALWRSLDNLSNIEKKPQKLDKTGFEAFKKQLSQNPRVRVK